LSERKQMDREKQDFNILNRILNQNSLHLVSLNFCLFFISLLFCSFLFFSVLLHSIEPYREKERKTEKSRSFIRKKKKKYNKYSYSLQLELNREKLRSRVRLVLFLSFVLGIRHPVWIPDYQMKMTDFSINLCLLFIQQTNLFSSSYYLIQRRIPKWLSIF
jgi:hypothetical protein